MIRTLLLWSRLCPCPSLDLSSPLPPYVRGWQKHRAGGGTWTSPAITFLLTPFAAARLGEMADLICEPSYINLNILPR